MGNEKVALDINIGHLVLHLKVEPESIPLYKSAEKRVNDILNNNKDAYPKLEPELVLGMVAFQLAMLLEEEQKKRDGDIDRLSKLSDKVDEFLNR